MRLIDADKFKENFDNETVIGKTMCILIDGMPTALDFEGLIAELRKNSQEIELIYQTDQGCERKYGVGLSIEKVVEIIKLAANEMVPQSVEDCEISEEKEIER